MLRRALLDEPLATLVTETTADGIALGTARGVPTWEREMRLLRLSEVYMETVLRFRPLAPFAANDVAQPITDVLPFGALQNVFRPSLLEGAPPLHGLHFVGDSHCHTNPLFAWGLCLGVDNGFELGRIIDEHPSDPEAQSLAYSELTHIEAEACYRAVAEEDVDRSLTWRGSRPPGEFLGRSFAGFIRQCAAPTAMLDTEIARAVLRRANLLDHPDALRQNEPVLRRVTDLQPDVPAQPPGSVPGRQELLEVMAGARTRSPASGG